MLKLIKSKVNGSSLSLKSVRIFSSICLDNKKLPGKKYDVGHSFVISKQHESLYLIDVFLCNTEDIILFAAPDTVRKNPKGIKIKDIMYFGYMVMDNNDENDISHINKKRRRN